MWLTWEDHEQTYHSVSCFYTYLHAFSPVPPDKNLIPCHLFREACLDFSTEIWALWFLSITALICFAVLITLYNFFLGCFFSFGLFFHLHWKLRGHRSSYRRSCSVRCLAPLAAAAAVSTLPLHNQRGITTKLFPFQSPSWNRVGILSYMFFFSWCLMHNGDAFLQRDERWSLSGCLSPELG